MWKRQLNDSSSIVTPTWLWCNPLRKQLERGQVRTVTGRMQRHCNTRSCLLTHSTCKSIHATAFYQSDTAKHLHVYHYAYALNITSQQSSYSESLIHCSYSWHLLTVAFFGSMWGGKGNRSTFVSVTQLLMSMVYCANTLCCLHWLKWGSVWPHLHWINTWFGSQATVCEHC